MAIEAANVGEFIDVSLGVLWTPPGIGIDKLWRLPLTHPFFRCSCAHDCGYDLMRSGLAPYPISKPLDKEFSHCCKQRAGEDKFYQDEAVVFYLFTRAWGRARWNVEGDMTIRKRIYDAQIAAGVPLTENTKIFS